MQYNMKESGLRIKKLRIIKGYKQEELAELLGISCNTIARIEIGIRGCSIDLAIQLAEVLGTSIDYIVCGKYPRPEFQQELKEEISSIIHRLIDLQSKL